MSRPVRPALVAGLVLAVVLVPFGSAAPPRRVATAPCQRVVETMKAGGIVTLRGTCRSDFRVKLAAPAVVRWTCSGCPGGVDLEDAVVIGNTIFKSHGHAGTSYVEAGSRSFQLIAAGTWSLTFTPAPVPKPLGNLVLAGRGTTAIAPIVVSAPTRVTWSCPHCSVFQVVGLDSKSLLYDVPKRGTATLAKGTYVRESVEADAAWTLRIGGAPIAQPILPAPLFIVRGSSFGQAVAAGGRFALAVTGLDGSCRVYVAALARPKPVPARLSGPKVGGCSSGDASVIALWLGSGEVTALVDDSPSPHGQDFTLLSAAPGGPALRQVGASWGWTDSDTPPSYGCAVAIVSGGGVVARVEVTNISGVANGVDGPSCATQTQTVVALSGASRPRLAVPGTWEPIATDGKQILLAALSAAGERTGAAEVVGLDGTIAAAHLDASAVKGASGGWLTADGIVLEEGARIVAPQWSVGNVSSATLAEGRVVYVEGDAVHVRRIRDGTNRVLLRLPHSDAGPTSSFFVAAGSFGIALVDAVDGGAISVARIPWRAVDRTLPA